MLRVLRTAKPCAPAGRAQSFSYPFHPLQVSTKDKEEELRRMQEKYGVDGEEHAKPKK